MKHILLYCVLSIVLMACAARKRYNWAKDSQSIALYENFLQNFPKSKYAQQARMELFVLRDEKDWEYARQKNTSDAYNNYLNQHPSGKYALTANKLRKELKMEEDWRVALNYHNIYQYQEFILRHPDSKYVETARSKIEVLREYEAWGRALRLNTIASYEEYLSEFPNAQNSYTARQKISKIKDDKAWEEASRINTKEAYQKYNANFPNGLHRTESNQYIYNIDYIQPAWDRAKAANTPEAYRNFLREYGHTNFGAEAQKRLDNLDDQFWYKAINSSSVKALREYEKKFPNGKHIKEMEKALIDKEVEDIFKGSYGQLPSMNRTSYGYSSRNKISVTNSTNYTLTVRYSGPESKKIVLPPHRSTSFELVSGEYRIAASVSAANVRNYAGRESLSGGDWSSEYYIQTSYR